MKKYSIDVWTAQRRHERTYSGNSENLLSVVNHISNMTTTEPVYGEITHIRIRELNYQRQVKYYNRLFMEISLTEWERLDKIQKIGFMIK